MRARGQGGSSSDGGGSDSDDAQTLPVAEQRVVPPRYRALLAFICVLALGATWYCNIYFVQEATGGRVPATVSELTVGLTRFLLESFVHPVASVVAVELYLLLAGTCIFVVAEGKRGSANPHGVAWPWLYMVLGYYIGVSFSFPLFLVMLLGSSAWRNYSALGDSAGASSSAKATVGLPGVVSLYLAGTLASIALNFAHAYGFRTGEEAANASSITGIVYALTPVLLALAAEVVASKASGAKLPVRSFASWWTFACAATVVIMRLRAAAYLYRYTMAQSSGDATTLAAGAAWAPFAGSFSCLSLLVDYALLSVSCAILVLVLDPPRVRGLQLVGWAVFAPPVAFALYLQHRRAPPRTL